MNERDLFITALQLDDDAKRAAYLGEACAGDSQLRQRVEALMHAFGQAGSFLQQPAADLVTLDQPPAEEPGTQIGPYKLLQQIGEGGFGVVYMAEQHEPVKRRVALKIIKLGMDTRQVIARFEAERQALSLMDHPNIAKVLDAGTTASGQPYFVMELVKGQPITQYCDEHHLTPRQRLELLLPVCQAIQHAHQKGIIHRDIKPTNILVAEYDQQPVPKVIDFGVAKAVSQSLTEKTMFTGLGQIVGTLEYMSPEQAKVNQLDIDTRSDIYSLGVLLYELLTGSTPFDRQRLRSAAFDEMLRIIREEEPPKPSTRLSDLSSPAGMWSAHSVSGNAGSQTEPSTLASIAALRHTEPAKLTKLVRGELDWIVMKALEKDRSRRYDTAIGLARDIERHLNDEQVQACPPSLGYRLGKTLRRYKRTAAAAALLLLSLVVGIVGTSWGMVRARLAKAEAVQAAGKLEVAAKDLQKTSDDLQQALNKSNEHLFDSLLNEARAWLVSGKVGQRNKALAAVREAAKTRITPALRDAAAAALVLPDVEVVQEWEGCPLGTVQLVWDASFQKFARINYQGEVTVFRLTKGREVVDAQLPTRGKPHKDCWIVMSPNGRYVGFPYSGGDSIWDLERPRSPINLEGQPVQVNPLSLAFRPDSLQFAMGHPDSTISVCDLPSGRRIRQLKVGAPAGILAFHPTAMRLAAACGRAVQIFDLNDGTELPALAHDQSVPFVEYLAWHPDGRRLVTAGYDGRIHWWNTETACELAPPWYLGEKGMRLAFNHGGDQLVSVGWGGQTLLWDVATGDLILKMPGNFGSQFSADDKLLGLGTSGTRARLSRIDIGQAVRVLGSRADSLASPVSCPVVHKDGRLVMTFFPGGLNLYDLTSGERLAQVALPVDSTFPFAYDPARGWLTWGIGGLLEWPVERVQDQPELLVVGPAKELVAGSFSCGPRVTADSQLFAVPNHRSTIVFNRDSPDHRVTLGPQYDASFCAVSPDKQWVATGSHHSNGSKSAFLWNAKTGAKVHELPLMGSTLVEFSPDGRWLATANEAGSDLWEVGSWRRARHFEHGSKVVFSPNSRFLAQGDKFGVIRLLETESGREIARVTCPERDWCQAECFTPDGTKLLATMGGRILVFDLRQIRQQLVALGLDWDWPPFPPAADIEKSPKPLRVKFVTERQSSDAVNLKVEPAKGVEKKREEPKE